MKIKKANRQIYNEYVNRDVTMCFFNLNYDDEWYEIILKNAESYNKIADELEEYKWDKWIKTLCIIEIKMFKVFIDFKTKKPIKQA